MKQTILFLAIVAFMAPAVLRAQDTTLCPLSCDSESFPYVFCDITGATHVECSTNPWSDTSHSGKTAPLFPKKSYIPGCVTVIPIDTSLDYQPTEPRPDPPTMPDPVDTLGIFETCYDEIDATGDVRDSMISAWEVDTSFVYNGFDLHSHHLDRSDYPNDDDYNAAQGIHACDSQAYYSFLGQVETYNTEMDDYVSDETSYNDGTDVIYQQVWSNTQADSDAQSALNAWLGICGLTGDPTCCILIRADNNKFDFPGNYVVTDSAPQTFLVAKVKRLILCQGAENCPAQDSNYIIYNATNSLFYKNNDNTPYLNPDYLLHPAYANGWGWFTGSTPPDDVYPADSDFSFKQMALITIGKWLGMLSPDSLPDDHIKCQNNETDCPQNQSIMAISQVFTAAPPTGLMADDKCMFAKLYCESVADTTNYLSVSEPQPPDWFNPQVFPNPSNGGMTLTFDVEDRSFVQITIYDVLGKEVNIVSSGYEDQGPQSLSLGTESLPSGNYVCRVRVGDRAAYINLAIVK